MIHFSAQRKIYNNSKSFPLCGTAFRLCVSVVIFSDRFAQNLKTNGIITWSGTKALKFHWNSDKNNFGIRKTILYRTFTATTSEQLCPNNDASKAYQYEPFFRENWKKLSGSHCESNLLLSGNMPDKPCIVVNSGNIN